MYRAGSFGIGHACEKGSTVHGRDQLRELYLLFITNSPFAIRWHVAGIILNAHRITFLFNLSDILVRAGYIDQWKLTLRSIGTNRIINNFVSFELPDETALFFSITAKSIAGTRVQSPENEHIIFWRTNESCVVFQPCDCLHCVSMTSKSKALRTLSGVEVVDLNVVSILNCK